MKKILAFISVLLIFSIGCSYNSEIVSKGKDSYSFTRKAKTGFSRLSWVKADAIKHANKYCEKQNKKMKVIDTKERAAVYESYARVTVEFMCVDQE